MCAWRRYGAAAHLCGFLAESLRFAITLETLPNRCAIAAESLYNRCAIAAQSLRNRCTIAAQ
jgi:hypothetical protein